MNKFGWLKSFPVEAVVWIGGFLVLAFYQPSYMPHFSVCPLYNLGFDFCPGCGLGRSIAFLFHGEFQRSFTAHPMGIFAVIILSFRIIKLIKHHLTTYYGSNY